MIILIVNNWPQNEIHEKFEKDYIECGKLLIKLKDLELMRIKVLEMKQVLQTEYKILFLYDYNFLACYI